MARYDRGYDYGLRGYRETTAPRRDVGPRGMGAQYGYDFTFQGGYRPRLPNRVTARYNRDYTYDRPYRGYRRNFNPYTGDRVERIGDLESYIHPYNTIGGSHTWRGAYQPPQEFPHDPLQDNRGGYGYDDDYPWYWKP
jgi:hypothetical protein